MNEKDQRVIWDLAIWGSTCYRKYGIILFQIIWACLEKTCRNTGRNTCKEHRPDGKIAQLKEGKKDYITQ